MQGKLRRTITKQLSDRTFKIFFTEGYIVYSSPREKHPSTGVAYPKVLELEYIFSIAGTGEDDTQKELNSEP